MPSEEETKSVTPYAEFESLLDQKPHEQPVANDRACTIRPDGERRAPDCYGEWATITSTDLNELKTVKEALASLQEAKWMTSMERELESLRQMMVELPKDRKAVWSKWVIKVKMNADRWVERYIAWLEFITMKHFVQLFVSSQFKLSLH